MPISHTLPQPVFTIWLRNFFAHEKLFCQYLLNLQGQPTHPKHTLSRRISFLYTSNKIHEITFDSFWPWRQNWTLKVYLLLLCVHDDRQAPTKWVLLRRAVCTYFWKLICASSKPVWLKRWTISSQFHPNSPSCITFLQVIEFSSSILIDF